jgi:ATP-dependent protease ClpP protease subunit
MEAKLIRQKGLKVAFVDLHGDVGWPSNFRARTFIDFLRGLGSYDLLYAVLDSAGGSPVDSWGIYRFLKIAPKARHGSVVLITGQCSADAILIALAFNQILMRPGTYLEFRSISLSRPVAGRRVSEVLARRAAERSGVRVEEVRGWMDKNKKLSADECLSRSLCDATV